MSWIANDSIFCDSSGINQLSDMIPLVSVGFQGVSNCKDGKYVLILDESALASVQPITWACAPIKKSGKGMRGESFPDCSRLRSRYCLYATAQTSADAAGTSRTSMPQLRIRSATVAGNSSPTQISARQMALMAAPSPDTASAIIPCAQSWYREPSSDE